MQYDHKQDHCILRPGKPQASVFNLTVEFLSFLFNVSFCHLIYSESVRKNIYLGGKIAQAEGTGPFLNPQLVLSQNECMNVELMFPKI